MTASSVGSDGGKHVKEERKLRKPLIERKRRERINTCLDQLKETVIGAFRLDQSKLEKADILEMTVKHLQNIQSLKLTDPTLNLEAQQKFSSGYIQCVHEVHNMLLTCGWTDQTLGSRLLHHLLKSLPKSSDAQPPQRRRDLPPSAPPPPPPPGPPLRSHHSECRARRDQSGSLQGSDLGLLEMWRPW